MRIFNTLLIDNVTNTPDLWNKIITIQKLPNNYVYSRRIYIKVILTSYVSSQWDSWETKQTLLEISNFYFQNNLQDNRNTYFSIDNPYNVIIKILSDDTNIYVYVKNYCTVYGGYINCNVIEEIGDNLRITYHEYASYEKLPAEKLEIFPSIKRNLNTKWDVNIGIEDWSKYIKILTINKSKENSGSYGYIDFKITCPSRNGFLQTIGKMYFSSMGDQSPILHLEYGKNSIYIKDISDDNQIKYELYTNCYASGGKVELEILDIRGLNTNEFEVNFNSNFISKEDSDNVLVFSNEIMDYYKDVSENVYNILKKQLDIEFKSISYILDNSNYIEYSGKTIEATTTINGKTRNLFVKGKSFNNINIDGEYNFYSNQLNNFKVEKMQNGIKVTRIDTKSSNYEYFLIGNFMDRLRTNTIYTVVFNVESTEDIPLLRTGGIRNGDYSNGISDINFKLEGNRYIGILTTPNSIVNKGQSLYFNLVPNKLNGWIKISELLILEGEYISSEIPSNIKGIESIGEFEKNNTNQYEIIIKSTNGVEQFVQDIDGKNIFNDKYVEDKKIILLNQPLRSLSNDIYDEISDEKLIILIGMRKYEIGDEKKANVITNKINTLYKLETPLITSIGDNSLKSYKENTTISTENLIKPVLKIEIQSSVEGIKNYLEN